MPDMIYFVITLFFISGAAAVYLWVLLRQERNIAAELRTRVRELEHESADQSAHRGELVNELIERYENEILKMGADIHDDLIQKLTVYRLHVDKLEHAETILEVKVVADKM